MNDKLYENGYVVLENFFTDKQVEFFMTQTVESIANKEMVLGKDMLDGESVHPMTWKIPYTVCYHRFLKLLMKN